MLALLLGKRFRDWSEHDLIGAAKIASYTATLVIQSIDSRLTPDMARLVQVSMTNYIKGLP